MNSSKEKLGLHDHSVLCPLSALPVALVIAVTVAAVLTKNDPLRAAINSEGLTVMASAAAWLVRGRWLGVAPRLLAPLVGLFVGIVSGSISREPAYVWSTMAGATAFSEVAHHFHRNLRPAPRRGRLSALFLLLLTGVALLQAARFSLFMVDPDFRPGWSVPFAVEPPAHMCLSAYLHAAELNRNGVTGLYEPSHYDPGAKRVSGEMSRAGAHTNISGMQRYMKDPFQYPPQVLLLPRLTLAVTNDFLAIRTCWYALLVVGMLALLQGLVTLVPHRMDVWAFAPLALFWVCLPVLTTFEYGQPHALVLLGTVWAFQLFDRERIWLGGSVLAVMILTKLFPGLLLGFLLGRGKVAPLLTTMVAVSMITLVSLPIIGVDAFIEFLSFQLPRLLNGEAFAPYIGPSEIGSYQMSLSGIMLRFGAMSSSSVALQTATHWASLAYLALIITWGFWVGRYWSSGFTALGLVNLAASGSYYAPAAYVLSGTFLVLMLGSCQVRDRPSRVAVLGILWLLLEVANSSGAIPRLWRMSTTREILMAFAFLIVLAVNAWISARSRLWIATQ